MIWWLAAGLGAAGVATWGYLRLRRRRLQRWLIREIERRAADISRSLDDLLLMVQEAIQGDRMGVKRIYLATSWRNPKQERIRDVLTEAGFEVYDFKAVRIDGWPPERWTWDHMTSETAFNKFESNRTALEWCDAVVAVMPFGRSTSIELGWGAGAGKRTAVLIDDAQEPELMLHLADYQTRVAANLIEWLREQDHAKAD